MRYYQFAAADAAAPPKDITTRPLEDVTAANRFTALVELRLPPGHALAGALSLAAH
ncbi:hypothetical protein ACFQ3Z_07630 [Streptomyces nogalater]